MPCFYVHGWWVKDKNLSCCPSLNYLLVDWFMVECLVFAPSNERVPLRLDWLKLWFISTFLIAWTCVHLCIMDRYWWEMSTRDSPNIPRKCSRYSQEGRTITSSSTETSSEKQQSRQSRFSNESVNRSTTHPAQASAMDAALLDRLCIDTPNLRM